MKKDFNYVGSAELFVTRIQVFSFSGGAVPFYWLKCKDGITRQYGGVHIGSLKDMEDPIFEARSESSFIYSMAYPFEHDGESLFSYDYAKAHSMVADSGEIEGRVLLDIFVNSKGEQKYCVGGSNIIYRKTEDGIQLLLDEVEAKRIGLCGE